MKYVLILLFSITVFADSYEKTYNKTTEHKKDKSGEYWKTQEKLTEKSETNQVIVVHDSPSFETQIRDVAISTALNVSLYLFFKYVIKIKGTNTNFLYASGINLLTTMITNPNLNRIGSSLIGVSLTIPLLAF